MKNPPLLYNLAELQNDCSKYFHLSPDQTLQVAQELYEKKLVTYPRTDARVLSTAVAKEITKNIGGLQKYEPMAPYAGEAMAKGLWKTIAKTRYVNDKLITDHYAIIPTGVGLGALNSLTPQKRAIYEMICRRFLSIFYPPAIYRKYSVDVEIKGEHFLASFRVLEEPGYLAAAYRTKGGEDSAKSQDSADPELLAALEKLRKGSIITLKKLFIREGETTPPKRYTSGSMILAMENAGQLIEDEELRAQIKGSGIGTSATRADILKKLVNIRYLMLNKKTQVITPSFLGEMVYEVVFASMKQMLNPDLTASWEKGLTYVSEGSITSEEYMEKLENFVSARTMAAIRGGTARGDLIRAFDAAARYYKPGEVRESSGSKNGRASG